jgi:hypothetical protein
MAGPEDDRAARAGVGPDHPELVQLALRRPTLGARARARVARDADAVSALADRVGRDAAEGRVVCECADVLFAEVSRALGRGATLTELMAETGVGRGACGGARCLDGLALYLAWRTGRSARAARDEVAALTASSGPEHALARVFTAYARLGDDTFDDDDDDEPELVVTVAGARDRGKR